MGLSLACTKTGSEDSATPDTRDTVVDSSPADPPGKNVLLLIADDMGVEVHPCYGLETLKASMPHIEALCARGVVFDQVWSNPVCSPTRASILTGRYPHQTGVTDVVINPEEHGLRLSEWTLPMALEAGGSPGPAKANIGKWSLSTSENGGVNAPNLLGWDHYEGLIAGSLESYFYYNEVVNGVSQAVDNYATSEAVDDAIRWVGEQEGAWFLWLAFNAPHVPLHLPPEELHSNQSLSGEPEDIAAQPVSYFLEMLQALDTEIGRLFEALGEETLANTDIVFLGDNGTLDGVNQAAYPPNHGKGSLYQGGIHVPLVISGPSVEKGGRRSDVLVSVNDLFATLLDLAGIPWQENLPEGWDGDSYSLLPVLHTAEERPEVRKWVMAEYFSEKLPNNAGRALRFGDYKLIQFRLNQKAFFNLATDPFEIDNLLGQPLSDEAAAAYLAITDLSNQWPTELLDPPEPE
jgi:arylsulfatase A-like enzyme